MDVSHILTSIDGPRTERVKIMMSQPILHVSQYHYSNMMAQFIMVFPIM